MTKPEPRPETNVVGNKPEANVEVQSGSEADPKTETQSEIKAEPNAKVESKPKAKAEPKAAIKAKPSSDVSPHLVERAHKLYEELGCEGVRTVEELEKAE